MTDEGIINQWKHERELAECVCSYFVDQVELSLVNETIDLINQQRAEIERLNSVNDEKFRQWDMLAEKTKQHYADLYEESRDILKVEAYKEFAERLKEKSFQSFGNYGITRDVVEVCDIDNLEKEMVSEEK